VLAKQTIHKQENPTRSQEEQEKQHQLLQHACGMYY
jgi:hypothetical protein